jgi:hypothetical protein
MQEMRIPDHPPHLTTAILMDIKYSLVDITRIGKRFIDYPTATAGALIMGVIVAIINYPHGLGPAMVAALKQAIYTFVFGGLMVRLLYYLMGKFHSRKAALTAPTLLVTVLTTCLVYLVHSARGTPEPLLSTFPTLLLAPFGFFGLSLRRLRAVQKTRAFGQRR